MATQSFDIEDLRERLSGKGGEAYWRSLEEVAETDEFADFLHQEFPEGAAEWKDSEGRRHFLKIMGASIALAGLSGCTTEPGEKIVPYVDAPEEIVPGDPLFYATAFPLGGYGHGVLAESHMGRPTKVEGNPDHPASMGATNALMQASVLDLYDPDRSTNVMNRGTVSTWDDFARAMNRELGQLHRTQGEGLRLLTGTVTSPTLTSQIQALLDEMPQARWYQFDPTSRRTVHEGVGARLGRPGEPLYHFEEAEVIFSIGSNFMLMMPGSVRYAYEFAERRRVRLEETEMNRLFAVESTPTITGAMADHRLPLPPSRLYAFVQSAAHELGVAPEPSIDLSPLEETWKEALVADLRKNSGSCLVVPGETHPPAIHELAHAMNEALGNAGKTVEYIEPVEARPENPDDPLKNLVREIEAGEVETLLMLGGNPVYTAPQDIDFVKALGQVPQSVHLSKHVDETSYRSTWHIPRTHYMETWSDVRAFDGTASIIQPLIKPLYEACHSAHEVLSVFTEGAMQTSYDIVTSYWRERYDGDEDFALFWQRVLHDGVVPGTGHLEGLPPHTIPGLVEPGEPHEEAAPEGISQVDVDLAPADTTRADLPVQQPDTEAAQPAPVTTPPAPEEDELEIIFKPSPMLRGGEFANNAWLQEVPKPITKLSWDNAALMSPSTAGRLALENQDVVDMQYRGSTARAAVWIVPGHADDCVTAYLGYGRERAGRVGDGVGFNAYELRTSDQPWGGRGLTLQKVEDEAYSLATTQSHHSMEGRELVREGTIGEFRDNPNFVTEGDPINLPSLYEEYEYDGYKWGMDIDANVCIGCQACVVACQSENNIPVVGKEEVRKSREMYWIRIDRYYKGDLDNPDVFFQPVPCMHCEKAPCEVVCPVYATVHDEEGLNVMIYNRCIGTRYCSNNCPYKVRRFNFLQYSEWETDSLKGQRNPDVTVRSRGVMEKCTYCIQRISAARIQAKKEQRPIRDGEILTACQQACPTQAIVFGDLNDETARVKHLEEEPHNYALLEELGTRPRTTYLAHFQNPNGELEKQLERETTEHGISPKVGPVD